MIAGLGYVPQHCQDQTGPALLEMHSSKSCDQKQKNKKNPKEPNSMSLVILNCDHSLLMPVRSSIYFLSSFCDSQVLSWLSLFPFPPIFSFRFPILWLMCSFPFKMFQCVSLGGVSGACLNYLLYWPAFGTDFPRRVPVTIIHNTYQLIRE